jgi:hypothetical protein
VWLPPPGAATRPQEGGDGDHVDITLERDAPPRNQAPGPWSRSDTSRRNAPQTTVTLGWLLLGATLLICLGLLLGSTWTVQALQAKFRRLAQERRRLNDEWLTIRMARGQQGQCPRCARLLCEQDWYLTQTTIQEPSDDD